MIGLKWTDLLMKIDQISFFKVLPHLKELAENPIPFFTDSLSTREGIVKIHLPSSKAIITDRPEFAQQVLQKNNKNYTKTKLQVENLGRFLGKGLLTSEGEYWLQQRRLIQPNFHRKKLADLTHIMLNEVNTYVDHLSSSLENGVKEVDMSREMMRLTFSVVSRSLFGEEMSMSELDRVGHIIEVIQKYVTTTTRLPYTKPWYRINGKYNKVLRLMEEADGILFDGIEDRKRSGERYDDLLDMLMYTRYEDTGAGMTDQQIRDEALILFVAGHETSANALTWLFYLLAQHPDVEQKILDELDTVVQGDEISFSHLPQLTYLMQSIQEGMRLYPPAWVVDRLAIGDDKLGDYAVKAGDMLFLFIYGTHHNAKYWEDPEAFRPERFDKSKSSERHRYAYFPFGGGPRLCIGNNFALMEMQLVIARLLQQFKFDLLADQQIELQPLVTLHARNGIKMRVRSRS